MLRYRHVCHAGNHADVLKHAVLVRMLEYLKQKDKPFLFIDTHAGAGLYHLTSPWAQRNREFDGGIGRLLECGELPAQLETYVGLIKSLNRHQALQRYPGSPALAAALLRPGDSARLFELHAEQFEALGSLLRGERRIKVEQQDGFRALPGLLPPAQRRALVLIDPPYQRTRDYTAAVTALQVAWRRFPAGLYLLWYPVVQRTSIDRLERDLKASGVRDVLLAELAVAPAGRGGMQASGLIIVIPPWTLEPQLRRLLAFLATARGLQGQGSYRLETLVAE